MSRAAVVVVVVLAATGLVSPVASPAAADAAAAPASVEDRASTATPPFDRPDPQTVVRINVSQNGDAAVAIESRFLVNESDQNETAAFESTYQDARDGTLDVPYSEETVRALVDDVSASTDREMAVENARWTRSISNDTGTIALRFTWTNFGIDRQETVVVGDAFQTEDGPWLPRIEDKQRLVVRAPDGYSALSPSDRVGERRLVWDGPHQFEPGSPSATFGRQETRVTTTPPTTTTPPITTTPGTAAATTNGTNTGSGGASAVFWGLLLVAVVAVGGGGHWYFNEYRDGEGTGRPTAATDGATTPAESTPVDADDADAAAAGAGGAAASDEAADAAAADEETANDEGGIDPELLSDEERVEHLLESNGGRMKQAQIVKETGWSNAKVSQLLSAMDEADRIDKLRIGRENLITLPDEDVTDF